MPRVDVVVKVGGGMLADSAAFGRALAAIGAAAQRARIVVVPGGGPFADTVRDVDRRVGLSPDAAHWAAALAMDQYAWVIADKLPASSVVDTANAAADALDEGRVPVLAVSRWLQAADPLPHSWDVTSDSIAAWLAGELGAARVLLIKPPGAAGQDVVDPFFAAAVPPRVHVTIVAADQITAEHLLT
jgi:aspartokinase-like uncharacterized kinase